MIVLAVIDWNEIDAFLTLGLVIAAGFAALYAKRQIDTQRDTSQKALRTQVKISEDALNTQVRIATEALDTTREMSAKELAATRAAAEAAETAVQRQIEATDRPLLIDVSETTSKESDLDPGPLVELEFRDGYKPDPVDWRHVYVGRSAGHIYVAVPLRNVGRGLAIIDPNQCRVAGNGVGKYVGCVVHRERVPPEETTRILCTHSVEAPKVPDDLQLLVRYSDFAGDQARFADVRMRRAQDAKWRIVNVRPVSPEDVALPR